MQCNRSENLPNNTVKQRKRSSINCNCQLMIKFQYRKKDKIKIIKLHSHHTHTYHPGKDQLVMVCTIATDYAKFTTIILKDLIKLIDLNHFVTSRTIRELLRRALSKRKYISSDDVVNVRVQAKLSIKQNKRKRESIDTFQHNKDTAFGLIKGLDNVNSYIFDKEIQCSKEIFEDYLHDPNHKIKFLTILDKLSTINLGFTYIFCMENEIK